MKKSLLALAVLGAFAGAASAQSSVTLYGTIDLSAKYVKNDGSDRRYSLSQDGINSSQLGFRGVEDLGGGLKASFVLLGGVNADSGTMSDASSGKFFNRRSTLSLSGNFGEIRLGRDYTPTFWNNTIFDAFGTNGLGDSSHVLQLPTATFVRADNSIQYFLPTMGGLYGQIMAAAAENGASKFGSGQTQNVNPGRYVGGRIGYAAGPFDVAIAYGEQKYGAGNPANVNIIGTLDSQKTFNIGGAYDFGVFKLMGYYDRDEVGDLHENRYSISGVIPLGQGEFHIGYDYSKASGDGFDNKVDQIAATYVYNLSKRTALYGTASRVSNGDSSANSVASGSAQTAAPTFGGKSTGFELGVRHFF
ncbi:MAG: porin [Proteobacteria bacterium]|nr:porin [Pseudomonadota bacterium]